MAATCSLAEMVIQVLQELSVLAGGQPVADEDRQLVETNIISVNEQLRELEICYWTDDAFPLSIKNALAVYVACHVAGPLYPGAPEGAQAFKQANQPMALVNLRRLTASRERVDQPTRATYY